jgi:hypothetical protein
MMSGDIVTKTKCIRVGEYQAQTSETMIDLAAIRLMLNPDRPCMRLSNTL